MIEKLVPAGVAAAELYGDSPEDELFPTERAQIARAVDKRRREYASARHCARVAMRELGVEPVAITKADNGAPQWPRGVTGSLTHCDGYRAAVLGHTMQVRSLGIDAEPHGPLPDGVLDAVSLEAERDWLTDVSAAEPPVHWDRLLFCAKEATYKAWFPLTERWLGFEDAHITFTADPVEPGVARTGRFASRLLVPGHTLTGEPLEVLEGRWIVDGGLIATAITLV